MEPAFKSYRFYVLAVLGLIVLCEMIWSWRADKKVYNLKETFANIAILAGFQFSKAIFASYQLVLLGWFYQWKLFELPYRPWVFVASFLVADFVYYWFHRFSHCWKPLWAFHLIHHSGTFMNLTMAYRLNWLNALVSPLFFIPLVLVGFPPDFVVISFVLNLLYQFFMHTEAIGKLGFLEGIIDTPSAHRVHHGSNPSYIDKNFGGVLMVWDRLFGTYQEEVEKPVYGITSGFISNNPLVLMFKGFKDLILGNMKYKG